MKQGQWDLKLQYQKDSLVDIGPDGSGQGGGGGEQEARGRGAGGGK